MTLINSNCGVYKITNPKGKIYIGSSRNIKQRYSYYKGYHCKNQIKLYNSLIKYGFENHSFEIIENCDVDDLFKYEIKYGLLYNSIGKNGLNLSLPKPNDKVILVSDETRRKISESSKGSKNGFYKKKHTKEVLDYLSKINKGNNNPMYGKKLSEETIKKIKAINDIRYANSRNRERERKRKLNDPCDIFGFSGWKSDANIILNLETGIYYDGFNRASYSAGVCKNTFRSGISRKVVYKGYVVV